ncbi:WYL domain-containing protein [soil metagenome]
MSARRTERLINLVICLLATRQFLSAERIRASVPGYEPAGSARADEAFKRMFERDKAELRDLGVPLETGSNGFADIEDGYRIARGDYELPDIELTADEAAAVGLAARLWQSAGLAAAASWALRKLRAAGIDVDARAATGIEPRVQANDAAFPGCVDAVRDGQAIGFDYRRPGQDGPQRREVEPWGVLSRHGRWYLVGHDRMRDATRVFRLSRIVGVVRPIGRPGEASIPTGTDLHALVAAAEPPPSRTARVRVRPGAAAGLRHDAMRDTEPEAGAEIIEIGYGYPESLADRLVGYGAAVVVLDPPEVREAVVRRLRHLAGTTR